MTVGGEGVSLNKRIQVLLNEQQKKFLKYVEKENEKEIDVEDASFMIKTVLLNLMYTFLISGNERDKRNSARMLSKLRPYLLEEVLRTNVIKREEILRWNI
ncbi:hypothetical protein OJ942_RS11925, partial [Staphylococcus pseudintermedius]|nr:hypothetical protein [Staphylococcus pseudintermedius]